MTAATGGSAVGGLALWALETYVFHASAPAPVAVAVNVCIPAVLAFAAGWYRKHVERGVTVPTERNDHG